MIAPDVGIDFYEGLYDPDNPFYPSPSNTTGLVYKQYKSNVYKNIKQLYYTNYIPDNDTNFFPPTYSYEPPTLVTNHQYDNFLSSLVTESRYFPTASGDRITVISIPSKLYGNNVVPNSFEFTLIHPFYGTFTVYDDGNGNIKDRTLGINVGNIMYPHGIVTLTSSSTGTITWEVIGNAMNLSPSTYLPILNVAFSSSINVYETQYKCTILENEFGFSLNPSLISGSNIVYSGSGISSVNTSNAKIFDFVTGSSFSPYVTTVGLYNDNQELMGVGKLSQPLQTSRTTDTTILINFDK